MQTLAQEIGFSETTFVTGVRDGGYDVRIFTPDAELPFAGTPDARHGVHARVGRIGSVRTWCRRRRRGTSRSRSTCASGMAWMEQLPPSFGDELEDRAAVARAAGLEPEDLVDGLPVVAGTTGLPHLMVAVRDEATLRRARRDDAGCQRVCAAAEAESLYLFTVRGDGDVMARMFDRGANIGEDPATGSAAGPLGAYLAEACAGGAPGHGRRRAGRDGRPTELPPRRGRTAGRLVRRACRRRRADRRRRDVPARRLD